MGQRTLKLSIAVWYRPEDGLIHIKIQGLENARMTTVSSTDNVKRSHPHLFNHLKKELQAAGKWARNEA